MRELVVMARARRESEWERISWLMATVMNSSGNYQKQVDPNAINPAARKTRKKPEESKPIPADLGILKMMFVPAKDEKKARKKK